MGSPKKGKSKSPPAESSSSGSSKQMKKKNEQAKKVISVSTSNNNNNNNNTNKKSPLDFDDDNYKKIRCLFLRCLSFIYFIAFLSIYLQIEGLYGTNGIAPVKADLKLHTRRPDECFTEKKSLLCYIPGFLQIDTQHSLELLTLGGVILSALGTLCAHCCIMPVFLALWVFYYSIYQVGNIFLWFQWDGLLLETGVLAIIIAPILATSSMTTKPRDIITMWMVKWLLFRLMFASGVVKLMSGCPTWWGLTALNYHFESQCLPTPFSYFLHQLPEWVLKLGVIGTYYIEIIAPFGFFAPFKLVKKFSFYLQILLQLAIFVSGNYNFFNLLTMVLCISLLDADSFDRKKEKEPFSFMRFFSLIFSWTLIGFTFYYTWVHFGLSINKDYTISSKIKFNKATFDWFISLAVPYSIALGFLTLTSTIARSIVISLFDISGIWRKIASLFSCLFFGSVCIGVFGLTLIPFSSLHKQTNQALWQPLRQFHTDLNDFHLVSSYGLFRRMTGTEGGRPEIILEYSNELTGPWKEYQFLFKPGNISAIPSFVAPHQPRLDWQMWFAALGTYQDNPWLVSLTYRLLQGQASVKKLMDASKMPSSPPKYIKANLYHYTYTDHMKLPSPTDWWQRVLVKEYMPIFSKDHPPIVEYMKKLGYLENDYPTKNNESFTSILDKIRNVLTAGSPEIVIGGSFISLLIIIFTSKYA